MERDGGQTLLQIANCAPPPYNNRQPFTPHECQPATMNDNSRNTFPLWRWLLTMASFLLGFGGVLWWQTHQDDRLLRQMEEEERGSNHANFS